MSQFHSFELKIFMYTCFDMSMESTAEHTYQVNTELRCNSVLVTPTLNANYYTWIKGGNSGATAKIK
jgi:predicted adenine nucleotide alpha hydrolase (AANH) superfamily ATPase